MKRTLTLPAWVGWLVAAVVALVVVLYAYQAITDTVELHQLGGMELVPLALGYLGPLLVLASGTLFVLLLLGVIPSHITFGKE